MPEHPVGRMLDPNEMLIVLNRRHDLHVSYKQLWSAAVAGLVPAYRAGRAWRFAEGDEAAIADHFRPRPHHLRAA